MASSASLQGVDMNDPENLAFYSQVLLFKNNENERMLLFHGKSSKEQRTLQTIAHSLGLEYEYSVTTRTITISRPIVLEDSSSFFGPYGSLDFDMTEDIDFDTYLHGDGITAFDTTSLTAQSEPTRKPHVPSLQQPAYSSSSQHFDYSPRTGGNSSISPFSHAPRESPSNSWGPPLRSIESSPPPHASRAGSMSSSHNAYSVPHRRMSIQNSYQEIVFDSNNSVCSESQASVTSGASGRRGRLSDWARAGMNAVKKVGACWRCKFLRKTCDSINPCALCPKRGNSSWQAVGCNRGDFKSKQIPVRLCPRTEQPDDTVFSLVSDDRESQERAAKYLQDVLESRDQWIQDLTPANSLLSPRDAMVLSRLQSELENTKDAEVAQATATLVPLLQCVFAIVWELSKIPSSVTSITGTMEAEIQIVQLLLTAAYYQAHTESDQLIAQSLICLRVSLEALRAKDSGHLEGSLHRYCSPSVCTFDCFNLDVHISIYLDELYKTFFKKVNLRNKEIWWLSVFYSFCIQSFVRKTLKALTAAPCPNSLEQSRQAQCHLHVPLRLFIAATGGAVDRLSTHFINSLNTETPALPKRDDYENARLATGIEFFAKDTSATEYLKRLFEDSSIDLLGDTPAIHENESMQMSEMPWGGVKNKEISSGSSSVNHLATRRSTSIDKHGTKSKTKIKPVKRKNHWTEIQDPYERRRIQNLLAQRKFREKWREEREKAAQNNQELTSEKASGETSEDFSREDTPLAMSGLDVPFHTPELWVPS